MSVLYTQHFAQFFDDNGDPLSGGKLYTYAAGTTTPKATYTDAGGATPNANPVVLDAAGRATVFLTGSYKFTLKTSGDVLVKETDNVTAFSSSGSSVDSITTTFTEDVVVAADSFIFADASDSNNTKRDTIQGILDLVSAGALVYISSATASASASLLFEGLFSSTYDHYIFELSQIRVATNATNLQIQTSDDAGPYTYDTSGYVGSYSGDLVSPYSATSGASATSAIYIAVDCSNASTYNAVSGVINLFQISGGDRGRFSGWTNFATSSSKSARFDIQGSGGSGNAVTGVKFMSDSGNLTSGTIRLYGVKKS